MALAGGVFFVELGSEESLAGMTFDRPLWLSMALGDEAAPELSPRTPFTAVGVRNLRVEPETATGGPSMIGGWSGNTVAEGVVGATIAGGGLPDFSGVAKPNRVEGSYGAVGGGWDNEAGGAYATIAGGGQNEAAGIGATIGGGQANAAAGLKASVGGGSENSAEAEYGTVAGGRVNAASGVDASVGGGSGNVAGAEGATVSGGRSNQALADFATVSGGGERRPGHPSTANIVYE